MRLGRTFGYAVIIFLLTSVVINCNLFKRNPVGSSYASGKALLGYDPVSYYTLGRPVRGREEIATIYLGTLWHFQNPYHLYLFKQNPTKWIAFYGYDAYELAYNEFVPANPKIWAIHNGKVYLFQDHKSKRKWTRNIINLVRQADFFWTKTDFAHFEEEKKPLKSK